MRTMLDINDALLAKAKSVAAQEQTSLTRLIEEGLAFRLRPQIARSDSRPLAIYPMVAAWFLRLVTHPKVFVRPTPHDAASSLLKP